MNEPIAEWVAANYPGATFVKTGGQRAVFRVPGPPPSALKLWPMGDAAQHERHVREVSALGRLSHPGLPKIVSHLAQAEINDRVFALYQEEWLDAPSVGSLVDSFPAKESVFRKFMTSALGVMNTLHNAAIVHRDISFNNVLWDGERACIIDLGLAKHLSLENLTSTGDRLPMTPLTASPEQLQGVAADLKSSTDIYSLGVIGFVIATGTHPFVGRDESLEAGQLVARQMNKDYRTALPTYSSVIGMMLDPVPLFRPTAEKAGEKLK